MIANDVDLHLPDSPADGITLAYGSRNVKLCPLGGSSSANLEDNSVTYPGYFGPETALRYTPLLSGVKEDIILSSYTGQNSFSFVLETDGLYLYETDDQYYLAENENAEAAFYLGQIVVYDAIGRPDEGSMAVEVLIPGQQYRLTLSADVAFLTDPETVYPVTIDPSLTVGYTVQGVNAIEDAPIFSGYPNRNFSNYYYNRIGYTDATYGTARTVMRPAALFSSNEWNSIDEEDITALKLYIKDSSGGSKKQVDIYALRQNSTWTETDITWNTVGLYSFDCYESAAVGNLAWSEFDLTDLAKAWKSGDEKEACGFLLKIADETLCRAFFSSEYSTVDYRPYMVLEYEEDLILSVTQNYVDEGCSFNLTARTKLGIPPGLSWVSSDTGVATVSENGVVTGVKVGKAIITVSCTYSDGKRLSKECTVYVTVADGVYYIKNTLTDYYLDVRDGNIAENTVVQQFSLLSTSNNLEYVVLRQMWKIQHIGSGIYSIRPMNKLDMGLSLGTNNSIVIKEIGETDDTGDVPSSAQWKVTYNDSADGYCFTYASNDSMYLQPINASTLNKAIVHASANPILTAATWELDRIEVPPQGAMLYNYETETVLNYSPTITLAPGEDWSIDDLNAVAISYSGSNISQLFMWQSNDPEVLEYDITTGSIEGVSGGITTFVGTSAEGEAITIVVTVLDCPIGTHLIKNKQTNCFVEVSSSSTESPVYVYQSDFGTPKGEGATLEYQSWDIQHLGDGFYSIRLVNTSSYLGVAEADDELNAPIVLCDEITERSRWRIEATESGAYKFIPECGEQENYVLATSTSAATEGASLIQGAYVYNTSYRDEWVIAFADAFMTKRVETSIIHLQISDDELTTSDEWEALINDAVEAWNNIHTDIKIHLTDDVADYTITVVDVLPEEYDQTLDPGAKGLMKPIDYEEAYIYKANILIFAPAFNATHTANYRRKVIAHEIGHLFGLRDNPAEVSGSESIMVYSDYPIDLMQFPVFDINNIKFLYNIS